MSPENGDWLEQLEARLDQLLDAFLQANPEQQQRLREQQLAEAHALRGELLQLAAEIQHWRQRVDKAKGAGANDLASQAQLHLEQLMERGRGRWQRLEQLGIELQGSAKQGAGEAPPQNRSTTDDPLDQAWNRFETDQALNELKRRSGRL